MREDLVRNTLIIQPSRFFLPAIVVHHLIQRICELDAVFQCISGNPIYAYVYWYSVRISLLESCFRVLIQILNLPLYLQTRNHLRLPNLHAVRR